MRGKARRKSEEATFAEALGADRVVRLSDRRLSGPLDWIGMAQALQVRLVSRGGRPSDPQWDTKRLVPFRRSTWTRLTKKARALSTHGRKVGPAQLAALLIERGV